MLALDPTLAAEAATQSALANVYDSLVAFDSEMRLQPALATSWTTPDDHSWVFNLRPGVRFHDGSPLTAADARDGLLRARNDVASRLKGRLASIESVTAEGTSTLRVRTVRPDPLLLTRLAYILIAPRPPLGTGAYAVERWEPGRVLQLRAFGDHWRGRPAIARVDFVPLPSAEERIGALRRREVELLRSVPRHLAGEVQALRGFRLLARAGLVVNFLWFDSRPGPGNAFADPRVRRAVALAVDRRRLVADVGGRSEPLFQLVPQGVFGHVEDPPIVGNDPAEARRLLAEAGHPGGLDVVLVTGPGASTEPLLTSLGRMLGAAGLRVKPEVREWPRMISDWAGMRIPFFVAGWRFETGEASSFLRDCLATPDPATGGAGCNPGYANPALDKVLAQIDDAPGDNLRRDGYKELAALAAREMPLVPLFRAEDLYAAVEGVRFSPRLDGRVLASEVSLGLE